MTIGILALTIGIVMCGMSLIGYATPEEKPQQKRNNYTACMPKEI